jgi:hypothetical protein
MIRIRGQICRQPIANGEAHSYRVFFAGRIHQDEAKQFDIATFAG